MVAKKLTVLQTETTKLKIREIYFYSLKKWGHKTAKNYVYDLHSAIDKVAKGLKHPRINPNFSKKFSYITCNKHHIFFEYSEDNLIVVTIFHVSMDVSERIKIESIALQKDIKNIQH